MRMEDKVVVITGAASGIGQATAKLFAQEGAIQILSDIDEEGLRETFDMLKDEEQSKTTIMKIDVTKPEEVKPEDREIDLSDLLNPPPIPVSQLPVISIKEEKEDSKEG